MKRSIYLLLFSLFVCYLAAGIGSVFTTPSIATWYAYLNKPSFNPPNWIFGPVWSLLYTMMGYALYLVLNVKPQKDTKQAILIFSLQLILNMLWSIVFFGLHFPGIAMIIVICLWMAIFQSIRLFWHISVRASYLLIPYLCWVSFAMVLNIAIVALN